MPPNNHTIHTLFDALADDYQRTRADVGWDPWPHLQAALGQGPLTGCHILDVGCADGEVAASLVDRGAQVTGVDVSPNMCAQAKTLVPEATFIVHSLGGETPLGSVVGSGFDAVVALGCLEYIENQEDALLQLLSAAKPGAIILYTVELRGPDLAGGNARVVPLFEGWVRYRLSRYEVSAFAQAHLDGPDIEEIPGYLLGERQEHLMYARVIGFKR